MFGHVLETWPDAKMQQATKHVLEQKKTPGTYFVAAKHTWGVFFVQKYVFYMIQGPLNM